MTYNVFGGTLSLTQSDAVMHLCSYFITGTLEILR